MNTKAKEITTGDLVFKVITKVIWFGLALAMTVLVFRETTGFLFNTLELESNFWVVLSGIWAFVVGTIFNFLYDGAFD